MTPLITKKFRIIVTGVTNILDIIPEKFRIGEKDNLSKTILLMWLRSLEIKNIKTH